MYIGQTIRTVKKRVYEHCNQNGCIMLHNAIQKYGFESLKIETLLEVNNKYLDYYEKKFIDLLSTMYPYGYNLTNGGTTKIEYSNESRLKMSQNKQGSKNHNYGKERSEITKERISQAKSGEKHHFYNKELTIDHKLKLSKSHKKEDDDLPMYMLKVKSRPEQYVSEGYAIINHPNLKNKYFTSKKKTLEEKYNLAYNYLNSTDAVQRLNGNGYFS